LRYATAGGVMTDEMIILSVNIEALTERYKKLYEIENGKKPVIWIQNNETRNGIFITDSFNTERIKSEL